LRAGRFVYVASKNSAEIRVYVQATNKGKMATDRMARTLAHFSAEVESEQ
jgi:hypothetical protein